MIEDTIDITDSVEVYENGKTLDCKCGHGIGVEMDTRYVRCWSCGEVLEDEEFDSREYRATSEDIDAGSQAKLGSFT